MACVLGAIRGMQLFVAMCSLAGQFSFLIPFFLVTGFPTPVLTQHHNVPPKPLGEVLMMVFDKDKDHRVTMEEVESTMHVLRMILNEGDGEGGSHYLAMLDGAQVAAPTIFAVLDSDQTGSLKSSELKWMTKFQKALKSGAMRNLTRSCFAALDVGPTDDKVSAAELEVAAQQDSPVFTAIVDLVHETFPIRKSANDLKTFVLTSLEAMTGSKSGTAAGSIAESTAFKYIDTDGDGFIDKKEAGKAYGEMKILGLQLMSTIQEMGPMMAMMGGGFGGAFGDEF